MFGFYVSIRYSNGGGGGLVFQGWCWLCVSMVSSYFGLVFQWMVAINLGVLVVGFWCFSGG